MGGAQEWVRRIQLRLVTGALNVGVRKYLNALAAILFAIVVIGLLRNQSMLKKIDGDWKLVSKSNPSKVLKNFGKTKPTPEELEKEDKRVTFFKNQGALFKGGK